MCEQRFRLGELGFLGRRLAKTAEAQAEFAALNAEVAVVVAYGLILPQAILDAPARGCLNIHASLLPRWRGAAPIHRAIMAGDAETGICIMQMDAGLDTGDVLKRAATSIGPEETTAQLHDRLSEIGASEIVAALAELDLLVMGAYGHSRMTELVLGGVTRRILQKAQLAVLLAH